MNITRYKEVESVFVEVVDLPVDQRSERIRALAGDQDLIEAVEELVAEHERLIVDGFMEGGVLGDNLDWETSDPQVPCPDEIHGYGIVKLLGRGASGTVYLAKSPMPLERLVALKLINHGAGKQTLARFREEQRVLARLEHKGIAKAYDEGVADDGRPFTVLEYVDGATLTEYCRRHELGWRTVLGLIIQCCAAVSHAHQRNIIHRDIKPSNLLVAEDEEGNPHVKVIDFGTAKLIDPYLMMSKLTIDAQFIGTLPYTSPEQLSGSETPDTRTDVYALGIVLYESLTGSHPFFEYGRGLKEAIELIMNTPIPEINLGVGVPARELGAILGAACSKQPDGRYSSLIHMGEDLQNLLDGMPVRAMRPKPIYIAKKFVGRHLRSLCLMMIVVLLLIGLSGVAVRQYVRANRSREALRESAIGLVDDLMPKIADLNGSTEARRELADSLEYRINQLLLDDPNDRELLLRKAYVLEYESDLMLSNDWVDEAEVLRTDAIAIVRGLMQSPHLDSVVLGRSERRLLIKLGDIAKDRRDFDLALRYYDKNHTILLNENGDHRESLCWSYERLSWIAKMQRRSDTSLEFAIKRLELSDQLLDEEPGSSSYMHNASSAHYILSERYIVNEQYDESLNHAKSAYELARRLVEVEPDKFIITALELHTATAMARSLLLAGYQQEAEEHTELVLVLISRFVDQNPDRMDAREIAWSKLKILRGLWVGVDIGRDWSGLQVQMRELMPERPVN